MEEKTMKVKDLYDYILKNMTAEQALMKFLESSLITYEHLQFKDPENPVHPTLIIAMAAMDMGWGFRVEKNHPTIRGLVVGDMEYMNTIEFKTQPPNDKPETEIR